MSMTDDDNELLERLRDGWPLIQIEKRMTLNYDAIDKQREEAAHRIEALSAENERLREALEKIIKMYPDDGSLQWACAITARVALGETK